MKQTAVEWLIKQISSSKYFYNLMEEIESRSTTVQPNGILEQAKEMEKKQMRNAYLIQFEMQCIDPNCDGINKKGCCIPSNKPKLDSEGCLIFKNK